MASDVQRCKQELSSEVTATQAAQIQLDRAAEDFRKLAAERSDLVRQYDQACEQMARRDYSIQLKAEQFAQQRAELRQKQAALDRQAAALDRVMATNAELEERIAKAERAAVKLRDTSAAENNQLRDVRAEIRSLTVPPQSEDVCSPSDFHFLRRSFCCPAFSEGLLTALCHFEREVFPAR